MNIAIIYHTMTGNTKILAKRLESKLTREGHEVAMFELETNVPVKGGTIRQPMNFEIVNLPDISDYDALCVGGPVWAFGPSTVIYKAIQLMPNFNGKKVLPFTTMGFPFAGMGGKNAINKISILLLGKAAKILPGIIIPKMFRNFDLLMEKAVGNSLAYFVK